MLRLSQTAILASAGLLFFGSDSAAAQTELTTELFVQGVSGAVDLTFAPGDPSRVFIVQQAGQIRVVENGTLLSTPFLNIDPIVLSGGERGLLGLAFHPDYQNNGRFFVNYTNNGGNTRVEEYTVSANPNIANPTGVAFIASINQDFSNHNGGCVRFGADGKLYVGMGDGGSGNDPNNRAQSGNQLLGKMLRFDVDLPSPYIPTDNPFVGVSSVRDEVWHLGMRNPWRFSFDRMTGDMWIGDVGQSAREEVDFIPAGMGGLNLGWRCKEGTRCTGLTGCSCTNTTLVDPIQEYNTGTGCSITGGVVYRGAMIPDLDATYFYADYCNSRIWSLKYNGTAVTDFTDRTTELRPMSGSINSITAFGEDHDGEVYIVTQSGRIWKIIPVPPACDWTNYCQATVNVTGVPAAIAGAGTTSITANNFALAAGGIGPGNFGLFIFGSDQAQIASGNGNLCIGTGGSIPLTRFNTVVQGDIFGSVFFPVNLMNPTFAASLGTVVPGETVNFQFWLRDNQPGSAGFNYSDGLSVLFCQ